MALLLLVIIYATETPYSRTIATKHSDTLEFHSHREELPKVYVPVTENVAPLQQQEF